MNPSKPGERFEAGEEPATVSETHGSSTPEHSGGHAFPLKHRHRQMKVNVKRKEGLTQYTYVLFRWSICFFAVHWQIPCNENPTGCKMMLKMILWITRNSCNSHLTAV